MSNVQNLAGNLVNRPRTSYKDVLSQRVTQQQAKEAQQRDIAENLQEGQSYMQEGKKDDSVKQSYTRTRKDYESANKDDKSSGGLFGGLGGLTETLIDGFKFVFKNLAPMLAGALVLLFPEATIDIVQGLTSALKFLTLAVLKTARFVTSVLMKFNDVGISPGELLAGAGAVAGATVVGRALKGIGKITGKIFDFGRSLFGRGPDAKKRKIRGLVGGGSRKVGSAARGSIIDRLKSFLLTTRGQQILAKAGAKMAATSFVNLLPGTGTVIWGLISVGLTVATAYELYEEFTSWDDEQEDGGQTQEEIDAEESDLKKGIAKEKKEEEEEEASRKSLQKTYDDLTRDIEAVEKIDVPAMFKTAKDALANAKGALTPTPPAKAPGAPSSGTYTKVPVGALSKEQERDFLKNFRENVIAPGEQSNAPGDPYDSRRVGGKGMNDPGLSKKSLKEVIEESKKGAVGKYQFIRPVLLSLKKRKHWEEKLDQPFGKEMQDAMAEELIKETTQYQKFKKNPSDDAAREAFQRRMAGIWASLPGGGANPDESALAKSGNKSRGNWNQYGKETLAALGATPGTAQTTVAATTVPVSPSSGAQIDQKSSEQPSLMSSLLDTMINMSKQSPTVVNNTVNGKPSHAVSEPASAWSSDWAYEAIRIKQLYGGMAGQPGM